VADGWIWPPAPASENQRRSFSSFSAVIFQAINADQANFACRI
jgi:hypothetical protein